MSQRRFDFQIRAIVGACLISAGAGLAAEASLAEQQLQGQAFVQKLLHLGPRQPYVGNAILRRVGPKGAEPPLRADFQILRLGDAGPWVNFYQIEKGAVPTNAVTSFAVFRQAGKPAEYASGVTLENLAAAPRFQGTGTMQSFGGSDFWLADFGFEFLAWEEQRKLKEEMCRSQMCVVLESQTTKPAPGGYARVESWIDKETNGLIQAYAYDAKGDIMKVFKPKSFRKIGGEWQLQEMEIRNVQARTQTVITFNLSAKPQ